MHHGRFLRVFYSQLYCLFVILCLPALAAPTQPSTMPFLRLEAGMHTAPIRNIDVDAQERFLVTASDDKTARIWSLASGELLRVLRPPLGPGNEGKLNAVAISPDGAIVAAAGYEKHGVFTYVLLQGLRGKADAKGNPDGQITIDELAAYVAEEVPRLTQRQWGYEQFPMRHIGGRSFPIGLVR
jgi:WD40 repeat protein